jgi:phage terminase large subunit
VVDVWKYDGELYVKEVLYETGLTNQDISKRLDKRSRYIADSAEPKSIVELQREGVKVTGAKKGKDSIKNSIDILKRYKINLIGHNLAKEFKSYKWRTDRATGKPINEPVDYMNHAIDALRYVALNRIRGNYGKYNIV